MKVLSYIPALASFVAFTNAQDPAVVPVPAPEATCGAQFYDFTQMGDAGPFAKEACPQNIVVSQTAGLQLILAPGCSPTLSYPAAKLNRGRVDVVMQAAGSSGAVTALVLYGDNGDEVDIELVGKTRTNFQSMHFPQGQRWGQVEQYHASTPESDLMSSYHKYSIERTDTAYNWYLDDVLVRSLPSTDPTFPASANLFRFGVWDGSNTSGWAGYVDYNAGPIIMAIESIHFQPYC